MISRWMTFIWMVVNFGGQHGIMYSLANALRYEPDWVSLDKRPLPQWYDEAKVGIFIHWGVYSVPSMGSEWFWNNWKNLEEKSYVNFMARNYKPDFSYQEFANEFTAELFNATQWALLFKDSGAKYVVLTSKHHDGYCLWPSEYSFGWNSMDVGPKRDIIMELSSAVREFTDLKFGLYYSLFEWFNRMYVQDKKNLFLTHDYVKNKVRPEQTYLVNEYRPEVIWSDGDWEASPDYWQSTNFLAWLYNDSPVRDTVVANDRWGFGTSCLHGDFYNCEDRYNPGVVIHHKWENAFTIDRSSWGQRYDVTLNSFLTIEEIIEKLVTTISCNGNILINIGPTKYGTISPIFEERLRQMGDWLKRNGEAIYNTIPWLQQNDTTPDVWYTCSKDDNTEHVNIYAIVLNYPYETNTIDIHPFENLSKLPKIVGLQLNENLVLNTLCNIQNITLLGMPDTAIMWHFNDSTVHIEFPPKHLSDGKGLKYAWTFKLTIILQ